MMRLRSAVVLGSVMTAGTITPVAAVEPGNQTEAAPVVRLGGGDEITLPDLEVVSRRLDQARSQLQPNLGATRYDFSDGPAAG